MNNISQLSELALKFETDKWGHHYYTENYNRAFQHFRGSAINLLEIGVGGYHHPEVGGHSLRMWKEYFPYAQIFAIDIYEKSPIQEDRIRIFKGSQDDRPFLSEVLNIIKNPHIIIDDGSHQCKHQIASFEFLFPFLDINGIYVIEDVESSYWPDHGGDSENLSNPMTCMNYFRNLLHGLNHKSIAGFKALPIHYTIKCIEFYKDMIFIHKGENL